MPKIAYLHQFSMYLVQCIPLKPLFENLWWLHMIYDYDMIMYTYQISYGFFF